MKKFLLTLLLAGVASAGSIPTTQVLEVGCQFTTGICKATLNTSIAATASRPCGGNVVKWRANFTSGAILTQEVVRAALERRSVRGTFDDVKCFEGDLNSLALTAITLDLKTPGY